MKIEVCVSNLASIEAAKNGGAYRVELCDNLTEGGTTPSRGMIEASLSCAELKTFVIIRPRGGNFVYSKDEIKIMQNDIALCGKLGVHGVVFGVLTSTNEIDKSVNKQLLDEAKKYNLELTYHRAFDRLQDLDQGLETLVELGFDRVLTSGGFPDVIQGKAKIKELITKANNRIRILPGGGVTESNIKDFMSDLTIDEIHGTFKEKKYKSMNYSTSFFDDDYIVWESSAEKIAQALNALK